MNGFSFPTELDRLRFLMRKAVNGILAEHLRESFPQYRRIYGLELPRIREICASFHPSRPLAIDLWNSNVREEMVAATLLFPHDDVSPDDVRFLLSTALTGELQQQLARNLLSFVLSEQQVCSLLESPDNWTCAVLTAAEMAPVLSPDSRARCLLALPTHLSDLSLFQARAVAALLRALLRADPHLHDAIRDTVAPLAQDKDYARQFLFQEVTTELLYG